MEKAQKRAVDLEDRLAKVATAIAEYKASFPSDLKVGHPALLRHLDCIGDLVKQDYESPMQLVSQRSTRSSCASGKNIILPRHNGMSIGQPTADTICMDCDCLDDNPTEKSIKPLADPSRKRNQHISLDEEPERESNILPVRIHDISQL